MKKRIKIWLAARRAKRAERMRQRLKYMILMDDMHDFFDGKKTAEQSWNFRQAAYKAIDEMTEEELLR